MVTHILAVTAPQVANIQYLRMPKNLTYAFAFINLVNAVQMKKISISVRHLFDVFC